MWSKGDFPSAFCLVHALKPRTWGPVSALGILCGGEILRGSGLGWADDGGSAAVCVQGLDVYSALPVQGGREGARNRCE